MKERKLLSPFLFPPEQRLQGSLELLPITVLLERRHRVLVAPVTLFLRLLVLLALAAFALAFLFLFPLVDDEHARGARFEAWALCDARVPETGCSYWIVG